MVDQESGNVGDLSAAISTISSEAPKLSPPSTSPAPKAAESSPKATPAASSTEPEIPVYSPDFKYKSGDKELEIPEKYRSVIKDKESEEELKKLFGQEASFKETKETAASLKKTLQDTTTELGSYKSGVNELRALAHKNDWDTWFKKMNIDQERIFQWVLDKVQYNQLPPEQRAQIDAQRNLQRQAEMAQEQVSHVSNREMALAVQMKTLQLEHALGKADVKSMSDAFDSRVGRPGAFRDAIIEHGKSQWALSNGTVDMTPEQAVADFVQKYGNPSAFAGNNPAAGAAASGQNSAPPVKVIPNVSGKTTSPVKQKPKSLDDLKRLRDSAIKEDNANRSPSQGYLAG